MNDKEKEKLSLAMYDIVVSIKDNVTLPTHTTIARVLVLSIAMLICSIISSLLKFYTFVSWQGCLVCVTVLLILLWVERAQNDTLIKAYEAGKKYAKKAESVAQLARGKAQPKPKQSTTKQKPKSAKSTKKGVKKK